MATRDMLPWPPPMTDSDIIWRPTPERIERARSLRELWHLRSPMYSAVSVGLSQAEATAQLEPADCCYAPVLTLDQAVETEQIQARGLVKRGSDGHWQALFPGPATAAWP